MKKKTHRGSIGAMKTSRRNTRKMIRDRLYGHSENEAGSHNGRDSVRRERRTCAEDGQRASNDQAKDGSGAVGSRIRSDPKGKGRDAPSSHRILYPRAWVVLGVGLCIVIGLALSAGMPASPMVDLGIRGLTDSFSISSDADESSGTVAVQDEVSWQGSFSNELPAKFDEEIGLGGDEPIAVSNDGRTIGLVFHGDIESVLDEVRRSLEEKGWTYVPSGQESACTFVKDAGSFRWLALTCVAVDRDVSVVLVPGEGSGEGGIDVGDGE